MLAIAGTPTGEAWLDGQRARPRGCKPRDFEIRTPNYLVPKWGIALLYYCSFAATPVIAEEYASGAGYSLTRDSNISRVSTNPRSEWIQAFFAGLAWQEHTPDLNAQLLVQAEERKYVRNVYQDDTGIYLNGSGVWTISPRRFEWSAEELYQEARADITRADTPANRTRTNTMMTGPDFTILLDSINSAQLGARYGRFDIEGRGDNRRRSNYVRVRHRVSEQTTLSLNGETTHVDFTDATAFPSVFRVDRFARLESRSLTTRVQVDAGTSRVTRPQAVDLVGRFSQFAVARQTTPESSLQISVADQYSDTFTDTLRGVTSPTIPGDTAQIPGTALVTSDLYFSRRREMAYLNDGPGARFGYSLRAYARQVDYQTLSLDHLERGGRIDWTWRPSADTRLFAQTSYLRRQFRDIDQTDTDRNSSLGAVYSLTRNLTVTFEATRLQHRVQPSQLGGYVDWQGMVLLGYSTGPLYVPRSRR